MKKKLGFDINKYLKIQTKAIKDRAAKFDNKLYLEFGGKLCSDMHAKRVLPGYVPDAKLRILKSIEKDIEIIYCISAKDIQKGRVRRDFGLSYDQQTLKDISDIRKHGLDVSAVVIALYSGEMVAKRFKKMLENAGNKVYFQYMIDGYPTDITKVVSKEGFGKQPYVKTKKPIIIITGAGGGSGKMSFCLSQMYHDRQKGLKSGYGKFETFPIWNLALKHPINIAYEAATADLKDVNLIDPFHKKAYGKSAVNYNRDIENFDIMKTLIKTIAGEDDKVTKYKSPTDMGVNMAGFAIKNDKVVKEAAKQEVIRRYFRYYREMVEGIETEETIDIMNKLMKELNLKADDRKIVIPARKAVQQAKKKGKGYNGIFCGAAIELPNGKIITGKNSPLLHAESAAVLNAVKVLAKIPDKIDLISPHVIENITKLKHELLNKSAGCLNVEETLIALAISAATNPMAETAVVMLKKLEDCEMHITHLPNKGDEWGLIKLGMNVTTDALLALQPHYVKK